MTDPVQVAFAGGSRLLRAGLIETLSRGGAIRVAAEADDLSDLVRGSPNGVGGVVLAYVEQARAAAPSLTALTGSIRPARCLVLTASTDTGDLIAALASHALGYGLLGTVQPHDLVTAVSAVARGDMWLCAWSTQRLLELALEGPVPLPPVAATDPSAFDLSAREKEVLQLLAKGHDEHAMSEALFLSRNTVKTYVRRIREKLNVSSRSDALRLAFQLGMIQDRRHSTRAPVASQPPPSARASEVNPRGWSA